MTKAYLCVATYDNWMKVHDKQLFATEGEEKRRSVPYGIEQLRKVSKGDILFLWATKCGLIGYAEVASPEITKDRKVIWEGGVYPYRIKIKTLKLLDKDQAISFRDIKGKISNDQTGQVIDDGNAIRGKAMIPLSDKDKKYLLEKIKKVK
ncbi:hypothetical protein FJZ53_07090 [Candidatus Woesearchaeota archaeon]|nr:hypothetical protein [Candidatus Woesearchaeota archaeon]